jgi:hypothetical protein
MLTDVGSGLKTEQSPLGLHHADGITMVANGLPLQ